MFVCGTESSSLNDLILHETFIGNFYDNFNRFNQIMSKQLPYLASISSTTIRALDGTLGRLTSDAWLPWTLLDERDLARNQIM